MALAGSILDTPSLLLPLLAIVPFVCLSRRRRAGVAAVAPPVQLHHGGLLCRRIAPDNGAPMTRLGNAAHRPHSLPGALTIPEGVYRIIDHRAGPGACIIPSGQLIRAVEDRSNAISPCSRRSGARRADVGGGRGAESCRRSSKFQKWSPCALRLPPTRVLVTACGRRSEEIDAGSYGRSTPTWTLF